MPSIDRKDFLYMIRPDAMPGAVHAVEYLDETGGAAGLTVCGIAWSAEWNDVKLEDVKPVSSGHGALCGVCDRAMRTRIREARESDVIASLRSHGEGRARRLLQSVMLQLAGIHSTLGQTNRQIELAASEVGIAVGRIKALIFEEDQRDASLSGEPRPVRQGLEGSSGVDTEQGGEPV